MAAGGQQLYELSKLVRGEGAQRERLIRLQRCIGNAARKSRLRRAPTVAGAARAGRATITPLRSPRRAGAPRMF